jgi:hypothetical protein
VTCGERRCALERLWDAARNSIQIGGIMDKEAKLNNPKLGWTLEELANSLSVSVRFFA